VVVIVYRFASCQTGDVDILALQLTKKERSQVNVNDDFLHSVSLATCKLSIPCIVFYFLLRRLSIMLDYRSSNFRDL
jgi:hypothetical protein